MALMVRRNGVVAAALVGYLVTASAIVAIALLLVAPEQRSGWFWVVILWSSFLVLLRWLYVAGFMSLVYREWRTVPGLGGIMPAVGILITGYTGASYVLLLLAAQLHSSATTRVFFVAQIALTATVLVLGVFIYFVRAGAIADTEAVPSGVRKPAELAARLKTEEDRLSHQDNKDLRVAVRSLREKIEYSIPHVGRVGTNAVYVDFAGGVQALCEEVSALNLQAVDRDHLQPTLRRAESLRGQIEMLARSLREG